MKKTKIYMLILTVIGLISFGILQAQPVTVVGESLVSANYFTAIITGVILALAIQFVLTALSVALGISAIGDIRARYVKSTLDVTPEHEEARDINSDDFGQDMHLGIKVTSGFGLWSVLTTCIALFVGTALAINLSVIQTPITAVVMALVIWAVFFLLLFYLEAKVAGTIVGNLISTVTAGIKSSSKAVVGFFEPSYENKLDNMIGHTLATVKDEFNNHFDMHQVERKVDELATRLDRKIPDYEDLRKDINNMVKTSRTRNHTAMWMVIQQVLNQALKIQDKLTDKEAKKKAEQLRNLLDELKQSYSEGDSTFEGIKYVVANLSNQEKSDVDERLNTFLEKLAEATPERFSKQQLQQDLDELLNHTNTITTLIANKSYRT